jgi:D-methionine transport system substrate-binding protein
MKTIKILVAVTVAALKLTLASCGGGDNDPPSGPFEVSIAGVIDHAVHTPGQSGSVTFSRFPASVAEFRSAREKIGAEPHGAVALQLMAYEMYRRNKRIGTECIRLNNTTNNVEAATVRLDQLFGDDAYYARPYQIAAFLKGASWENGYNPSKPYTVEVKVNDGRPYDNSADYQAPVLYLEVLTKGKDHGSETVYVLKTARPGEPGEGRYFIVNNSPGLYSQVKEVSFTVPFGGLD